MVDRDLQNILILVGLTALLTFLAIIFHIRTEADNLKWAMENGYEQVMVPRFDNDYSPKTLWKKIQ